MYTDALLALESSLEYGRDEQQVLAKLPLNQMIDSLQSDSEGRIVTVRMLGRYARQVSAEVYLPLLGDSDDFICQAAARVLHQTFPEVFQKVIVQAEAMLQGEPTGALFASRVQSRLAEGVAMIGRATPEVLTMLVDLLDWPYWEVRVKAAQALGALHRNIPDRAIRRLLELRNPPEPQAVRKAADDALTEILSRENSIEDDV